ncbi:MAG TPA: hypothetical protein ENG65_01610 [Candidatus Bathyarchaeota archaeon]|nr:hypothetical protein [Candidatus Bathyarchaeota archaeon]
MGAGKLSGSTLSIRDWAREEAELRDIMARWIHGEIPLQEEIPWRGGHDEGTFAYSWFPFYLLTGDKCISAFLGRLKDRCLDWMDNANSMYHGYWRSMDVHHGTELFNNFLAQYIALDGDKRVVEAFEDVAHHIGNWIKDMPEWYDWRKRLFKSEVLGTERIEPDRGENLPCHFRLVQILLEAYIATGRRRYLDLSVEYVDHWIERSKAEGFIPLCLNSPVTDKSKLEIVEEHAANNAINILMDLYLLTGRDDYIGAVRKLIPYLLGSISDPNNNMSASLIAKYRIISGDGNFDDEIIDSLRIPNVEEFTSALMIFDSEFERKSHPLGLIGRRRDEPTWAFRRADGEMVMDEWSPSAHLLLASQIRGDEDLAALALWRARVRLKLAITNLRLGRNHGCAANTASSVAAGHGRSFPYGNVTSTLFPATLGGFQFLGWYKPHIKYYGRDGRLGIPAEVQALFFPATQEGENRILIHNGSSDSVRLSLELTTGKWRRDDLENIDLKFIKFSERFLTVEVPANTFGEIRFT